MPISNLPKGACLQADIRALHDGEHQGLGRRAMIRFIILGLAFLAVWFAAARAIRLVRTREIDWTGVVFMIGFVVIAFYLRQATGMG
jgi:hypothetical protein